METDLCSLDPRYEEEVSGCTASVGILSSKKIYVVSSDSVFSYDACAYGPREMLGIPEVF
jgi:hypothetical protein